MITGTECQPYGMRSNQSYESNRAGAYDRNGGQDRAREEEQRPPGFELQPDTPRAQLSRGEYVEWASDHERHDYRGQGCQSARPGTERPLQVAREPEHHPAHARRVGQGQQNADNGAAGAGEHNPSQQQAGRAAATCEEIHDRDGTERSDDRGKLHREGCGSGSHGEQRADRGAS